MISNLLYIIAKFFVSMAELCEAEGRVLRRCAGNFLIACLLFGVAAMLVVGGVGLFLWGWYAVLLPYTGHAGAGFIVGGLTALFGILFGAIAKRLTA